MANRIDATWRVLYRAAACAACAASLACDWPWRHDMSDQPSPAVAQGPRSPVQGTWPLAAHGPIDPAGADAVANPLPSDPTLVETGRALYAIYCVPCHGTNGSGRDGPVAPYFPRVGNLASPDTQKHGDGWLYAIITTGTQTMPSYAHELNARERWQIVRFVRTLSR